MVKPQQQRSDRDRDRRQHPVRMTGSADDHRQDDRRGELDHRRDRDRPLDPLPLRTLRPRRRAAVARDRVDKYADHDHAEHGDQHSRDAAADHHAPADDPERGKRRLNQPADPPHPPGPCGPRRQIRSPRRRAKAARAFRARRCRRRILRPGARSPASLAPFVDPRVARRPATAEPQRSTSDTTTNQRRDSEICIEDPDTLPVQERPRGRSKIDESTTRAKPW